MIISKALFVLLFLFASIQLCSGQEKPEIIGEFGKLCSEDLMSRTDSFLFALQNNPGALGYIIFYGDYRAEGRNLNYLNVFKNYAAMRRFDPFRLIVVRGANRSTDRTQFWLLPPGAASPEPEQPFVQPNVTATTLFDKSWADFHKPYGKLEIYSNSFYDLGCDFSPNVAEFSNILLNNQELTGYIVVYTKFGQGKKRGNRVGNFAVQDLIKNHKIPKNRLKMIYGGNRREPELELWLVPTGDQPPTPAPDPKLES